MMVMDILWEYCPSRSSGNSWAVVIQRYRYQARLRDEDGFGRERIMCRNKKEKQQCLAPCKAYESSAACME